MGFFDNYTDVSAGGTWVGAAEKEVLIQNGVPLSITNVVHDPHWEHGERFVMFMTLPGSEDDRKMSFRVGTVESRDRMLRAMTEHFAGEGEPATAKLTKVGRSILIVPA